MDFTLIAGLITALGLILFGITTGGVIDSFVDASSIYITVGGTIAVLFMSVPMKTFLALPKHVMIASRKQKTSMNQYIEVLVDLAQEARVKGLLALEEKVDQIEIDDPFLKYCVMLIIDALEASKVREQISNEIGCIEARHSVVWKLYERGEALSPGFGMIGTLIGLINMLADLDPNDATALTKGMAVALITTFYGTLMANIIFAPIGSKLKAKHEEEMVVKELIMEGILSIQAGENPKYIKDKLKSFLTMKDRQSTDSASEGADE